MLPVKLLEYVALDIPVVVPRLKTIEHYFADDMVAYYDPENVQSLADSIYRLFCRAAGACRDRPLGHARSLAQYGWERQGADLVRFYQSLMEQ